MQVAGNPEGFYASSYTEAHLLAFVFVVPSPWNTFPSISPDASPLIHALVGIIAPYKRELVVFLSALWTQVI